MGKSTRKINTNKFGLIGQTLVYSFSKNYFEKKFQELELGSAMYTNFEFVNEEALADFLLDKANNLQGFNVTIPYKETIIPYLDKLVGAAKEIKAVNTVQIKKGKLIGYNTDVFGFINSIKPLLKDNHKKALVLGTGGASKAIVYALKTISVKVLQVSRSNKNNTIQYQDIDQDIIKEHQIIINCTPLGTYPNVDEFPNIPYKFLAKDHIVYDLVYNPELTTFLLKAKEQGASIKNGLNMLKLQADKAWEIWNS